MKKYLFLLLVLCGFATANAQPGWVNDIRSHVSDSTLLAHGHQPLEYEMLSFGRIGCYNTPKIVDNDSLYELYFKKCEKVFDSIDFTTHFLVNETVGGDCHARYYHQVYLDTGAKKMIWKVYNEYGGCRAGGGKSFTLKLPKLPKGYTFEVREVLVDRIHNRYELRGDDW